MKASLESAVAGDRDPWRGFSSGIWQKEIDVRDFIQQNYTPHEGEGAFLKGATPRTYDALALVAATGVGAR
jgi:formate C-acetyltransferase